MARALAVDDRVVGGPMAGAAAVDDRLVGAPEAGAAVVDDRVVGVPEARALAAVDDRVVGAPDLEARALATELLKRVSVCDTELNSRFSTQSATAPKRGQLSVNRALN